MMDNQQIWEITQHNLRLQMTQATYDETVKHTCLRNVEGNTWTIGVDDKLALQWLENRLFDTVQRSLTSAVGKPITLQFANGSGPPAAVAEPEPPVAVEADLPEDLRPEESPGKRLATVDYFQLFFGKGSTAGYAMVSHYASQFWAPYLGRAFLLWKRLDADARNSIKVVVNRWSEPQIITYNGLKDALNYPHTRYIGGQIMECPQSVQAIRETEQPLAECCMNHSVIRTKTDQQQRPRCYYWYVGQLEELHKEKLVAIEVTKTGSHPRSQTTRCQVWRFLPMLTPHQIGRLNGELKKDHERWIKDFGHLLDLDFATWANITEPTLVDMMEGYDTRILSDNHTFSANFLKLPCSERIGFTTPES